MQPLDLRERWQLSADDWDWIRGDLQGWRRGRPGTQFCLLIHAVEAICKAERLKHESRTTDRLVAHSERLAIDRLCRSAVAAARLSETIAQIGRPSRLAEAESVRRVLAALGTYVSDVITQTVSDEDIAALTAQEYLTALEASGRELGTGPIRWVLVRDLVYLASHRTVNIDERTIRRYKTPKLKRTPARRTWSTAATWALAGRACRRAR